MLKQDEQNRSNLINLKKNVLNLEECLMCQEVSHQVDQEEDLINDLKEIDDFPEDNDFEDLKKDFIDICGYDPEEAEYAANNVLKEDLK